MSIPIQEDSDYIQVMTLRRVAERHNMPAGVDLIDYGLACIEDDQEHTDMWKRGKEAKRHIVSAFVLGTLIGGVITAGVCGWKSIARRVPSGNARIIRTGREN